MTPLESSAPIVNKNITKTIPNGTRINSPEIVWKIHYGIKHPISIEYPSSATINEGGEAPYDPEKDLAKFDCSY